jgi:hypothetical protein
MAAALFFAGCQIDSEEDDEVEPVKPVITTQPRGGTYEKGATDAAALTVQATVTDDGVLTYQWYESTAENAPGKPLTGKGSYTSYPPSTDTLGTRWYYVEVTNTKDKQTVITTSDKVSIGITSKRVSFMVIENAGYGNTVITEKVGAPWTLNVSTPQEEVYVGLLKIPAQTIGVSGTGAARVRLVNSSDTINGDPVKIGGNNVGNVPDYYTVFKVDTSDFKLLFDEREEETLTFTLDVSEDGTQVQVPVTLNIAAPVIIPESITIFSVTRTPSQTEDDEGSLRKINAEIAGQSVLSLEDALKWIDQNVADGHPEYLVRVEKDEKIQQMVLSLLNMKSALIRLRGYKQEQKITHDGSTGYYGYGIISTAANRDGLITLGLPNYYTDITLQLEQHITLDGEDIPPTNQRRNIVTVTPARTLIMKPGSKITRYNNGGQSTNFHHVIRVLVDGYYPPVNYGKVILSGGEITENTVARGVIFIGGNLENNGTIQTFTYNSGKIHGNVRFDENDEKTGNYLVYAYEQDDIKLEEEK